VNYVAITKKAHQPSPKVLAARRNGRLGGLARAKNNSKEKMAEWSSKGGFKTSETYGSDLHSHAAAQRKKVGRYSKVIVKVKTSKRKAVA